MCSWQETVRTPTESWQEGDFRSHWKDLLPKWLEFRHSVDGGIVVTVGWWLRFWEDNIHPKAIEFKVEIFVAKPEHKPREPWKQQESNREV